MGSRWNLPSKTIVNIAYIGPDYGYNVRRKLYILGEDLLLKIFFFIEQSYNDLRVYSIIKYILFLYCSIVTIDKILLYIY